jgi:DNA polymerase III delta subunit
MITLIHGDDITKSRTDFLKRKETFPDVIILDGNVLDITDLTQELSSGGFFAETNTLFIENLFQKRKDDDVTAYTELLKQYEKLQDVILWEGKEVGKKTLTALGTHTPLLFKLPQTLFAFLDTLRPNNTKLLLTQYHQTLQVSEPEMIFFMLIRQFRLLLAIKNTAEIDETKRMAPWQRGKFVKQASLFSEEHLLDLYQKLYVIESGMKTGGNVLSLSDTIDIFLTEI